MSGTIVLADGNGTVISNGQIVTGNVNAASQSVSGSLVVYGNTPSTSPTTGTIVSNGGGIGTTGNVNIGKSLNLTSTIYQVTTSMIESIDNTTQVKLYDNNANSGGILLGNVGTNLTIASPVIFASPPSFSGGNILAQSIQQVNSTTALALYTNANANGLVIGNSSMPITNNSLNTFSLSPLLPLATTGLQAAVLNNVTNAINALIGGSNSWSNSNTYSVVPPKCSINPTLTSHLTNKSYVDTQISNSSTNLLTNNNTWLGTQTYTNTTNATSASTGTISTQGGVGVSQDVFIGGNLSTQTVAAFTSSTTNNNCSVGGNHIIGGNQSIGGNQTIGQSTTIGQDLTVFGNSVLQSASTTQVPSLPNHIANKQYVDTTQNSVLTSNETFTGLVSFAQPIGLSDVGATLNTQLGYTIQVNATASTSIPTNTSTILCLTTIPTGKWLCQWSVLYYLSSGASTTMTYHSEGLTNNGIASNFLPSSGNPATMQSSYASEVLGGTNGFFVLKTGSSVIDSSNWGSNSVFLTCLILYASNTITTNTSTAGTGFALTRIA